MLERIIPKKVVCDLDGVLGDVTPGIISSINDKYGTTYGKEDWTSWNWPVEQLQQLGAVEVPEALA